MLFNQPSLPEVVTGRSRFANSAAVDGQLIRVAAATPAPMTQPAGLHTAPEGVTPRMTSVQEKDPVPDTFLLYPKTDTELLFGDTRKITAVLGTTPNLQLNQGATVMVTGGAAPAPGPEDFFFMIGCPPFSSIFVSWAECDVYMIFVQRSDGGCLWWQSRDSQRLRVKRRLGDGCCS